MAYPSPLRRIQNAQQAQLAVPEFEPLLYSVEAAALLCIHPKTLRKMVRHDQIQGRRIGRCWRFRASDLKEWLWRQECAS